MAKTLMVRIHRVTCIDETGGTLAGKFGNDEMYVIGYAIDNNNQVVAINPVNIYSNFDDGDVKNFYTPLVFHQFYVEDPSPAPQNFAIGFILVEKDMIGTDQMRAYANEGANVVRKALREKGAGMLPGSNEQLVKWNDATNVISRWVMSVLQAQNDDFFPQIFRTSTVTNGAVSDPYMEYFTVKGHDGTYKMEHDWVLV